VLNYLKNGGEICQQIVANLLCKLISSTNITNLYDITEILLKVVDHMKNVKIRSRKSKTDREYNG
jgi:hypothetical protein